jgi:hypothetical protein
MNAMARLTKLNRIHGTQTNIHVFNMFYGVDFLRMPMEDFETMTQGITASDVLRVNLMAGSSQGRMDNVVELMAA